MAMKKSTLSIIIITLILVLCNVIIIKAQINIKDYENGCLKLKLRVPSKIVSNDSLEKIVFYVDLKNCGKKLLTIFELYERTNAKFVNDSGFYFEIYEMSDIYGMVHYPYLESDFSPVSESRYIKLLQDKSYSYPVFFFNTYPLAPNKTYRIIACFRIARPDGSYYLIRSDYVDIELR